MTISRWCVHCTLVRNTVLKFTIFLYIFIWFYNLPTTKKKRKRYYVKQQVLVLWYTYSLKIYYEYICITSTIHIASFIFSNI